jgi:hypothetical protein
MALSEKKLDRQLASYRCRDISADDAVIQSSRLRLSSALDCNDVTTVAVFAFGIGGARSASAIAAATLDKPDYCEQLVSGLSYQYRALQANFIRPHNVTIWISDVARLLAVAMFLEDREAITILSSLLRNCFEEKYNLDKNWLFKRKFEPAMLRSAGKFFGIATGSAADNLDCGPYNKWLVGADCTDNMLLELCDWHLERNSPHKGELVSEFDRCPFDVIPFEVWALCELVGHTGPGNKLTDWFPRDSLRGLSLSRTSDDELLRVIALIEEYA